LSPSPTDPFEVHYTVMPPFEEEGEHCFGGTISIDGRDSGICGERCIDECYCPFMAADDPGDYCAGCGDCSCAACEDHRVESCEVSGYSCAWKKDCNDDLSGMTRAAYVWKSGECYCWDDAQQNWFPTPCPAPDSGCCSDVTQPSLLASTTEGTALRQLDIQTSARSLPGCYTPGVGFEVTIYIDTGPGLLAMALEDRPPTGWTVGSMSDNCEWSPVHRKVKCGPFFGPFPNIIRYTVTPPEEACGESCFTGAISFNGEGDEPIGGHQCLSLRGDFDCDRDVDLGDFIPWEECMTGPDAGPYEPAYRAFDSECDGDIDLADFATFQRVFGGP
jgi:hypothetical protein